MMQFRLITLFKWTTAIAVVLPFVMWTATTVGAYSMRVHGPPMLFWGRFLAVYGTIAVGVLLFLYWGLNGKGNDPWITYGLMVGVVIGVLIGMRTSLGEWAIDTFNPKLPYQDFRTTFGVIVGVVLGAWFGALFGGIASSLLKRKIAA